MSDSWILAIERHAVSNGDVIGLHILGHEIALYGVNGEIYASDNACPHGNARLCDGFLEGDEIECPLHQGRFNVKTGNALCKPVLGSIRVYPVRIEDGRVFVALDRVAGGAALPGAEARHQQ